MNNIELFKIHEHLCSTALELMKKKNNRIFDDDNLGIKSS